MKSIQLDKRTTGANREFNAVARLERAMLILVRRALTTSGFLFAAALLFVGASLSVSLYTDAWHWFQRSGALLVSIGAVLSTQRALRVILDAMIDGIEAPARPPFDETRPVPEIRELRTCVCGFLLVAMGTLIWAYGDLVGCLLRWDGSCLA